MLSQAQALRRPGREVETREAAERGVEAVRCDQHPGSHLATGRRHRDAPGGRREPLDRALPPHLDPALDGALRQRRGERGAPDAEARRGESPFGARAVLLDVPDPEEPGAVGGADPFPRPERLEHAHARRHEPFAARLVGRAGAPLEEDRREARLGGEDRGGQPRWAAARDRDVEAIAHGRVSPWRTPARTGPAPRRAVRGRPCAAA